MMNLVKHGRKGRNGPMPGILLSLGIAVCFLLFGFSAQAAQSSDQPDAPQCSITYVFESGTYTVSSETAMSMMMTNEDGSYYIDPNTGYYVCDYEKMEEFFSGLEFLYPTAGTSNTGGFVTTAGEVLSGYDGSCQQLNKIDTAVEIEYLASAIMEQRTETHTPTYRMGGTYIEIDIANQALYYYEEGSLAFTTAVVTGSVKSGRSTPTGVYSIRGKARDINLVGDDYVSFVSYWMNFIGNSYGIHDASWRSNFGGTIYQTNGSHGCVNVPTDVMPELYEMVSVGTPVVIYE